MTHMNAVTSTRLSSRLQAVKPSPTIAMTRLAAELRRQGKEIIGLSQGEPDFDTPEHIRQAAKAAIDAGQTRYTDVDGTPELKQAVAAKFKRENGLDYGLDQISVGTGGKQVLYNALLATLDDGDEVIIPAPYWVSYPDMVRLAGGVPVTVSCPEEDDFLLTAKALRAAITPRTRWLILNSPSNPTGAGYSAAHLKALAEVLLEFPRVFVMTDDMYEHIRYDGWEFATIAAVEPRLLDRTLTCNGVSKAYSMTGWRIGFAGGPADLIKAMATLQSQSTSNPSSVSQAAAVAALNGPMDFLAQRNETFRQRRDLCLDAFNAIDGLSCVKPVGAFYLFPSCAGMIGRRRPDGTVIATDTDFVMWLLEDAGVAAVPGSAFGLAPYMRISFATATERLEAACARIKAACDKLS
jgi:aspartate aminotransferase